VRFQADLGADYRGVYFDVASHLISEAATGYDAYEFFNSKEKIAAALQSALDAYFVKHLHATVVSLQIQSCRLPEEFNQVHEGIHQQASRGVPPGGHTFVAVDSYALDWWMFASVVSLSLFVGVQAITDTVTQRQNITNAQKFLGQMTVSLQTNLLVAAKVANATVKIKS
jgi:hypothetical protein